MNQGFLEALKLIGSALAGLIIMGTVYTGFVTIVGGRVIPWLSEKEMRSIVQEELLSFRSELNLVETQINRQICIDYNDRLKRANAALTRNVADMMALDLRVASLIALKNIPGCDIQ